MSDDIPVWAWVLIAAGFVLLIAWIIYSVIIVYQFSVRGKQVGAGRWFIVGLLIFILLSAAFAPAHAALERVPFMSLLGLFAVGIIVGVVRNTKKPVAAANSATTIMTSQPSQSLGAENISVPQGRDTEKDRLQYEAKYCFECGALIRAKAEICPKCGVRQPAVALSNARSKLAAALFALFLGGLGIHKFYLGQIGWGIVYLLFCWTLIPAIIGFIEGIVLLTMSESDFATKYNAAPRAPS
jgi:TM2 domain-containing membrane protein YozV/ribosomal protein L40E